MALSRRTFLQDGTRFALALALNPLLPKAVGGSPDIRRELESALQEAVRAGACPGAAVEVALHGRRLASAFAGRANLETGGAVGAATLFRIGSLTKQFTAALMLKLAAQGKLELDAPVARYLPFFSGKSPFTLRELANHTAGLHSDDSGQGLPESPTGPPSQVELARVISQQTPLFDFAPGTAWQYSNANYLVLGAVIEQVAGKPLGEVASELLFRPLGLDRTAFDTAAAVVPGRADGYTPVPGRPGAYEHAAFLPISQAGGAGAMRSDGSDLCRWHQALFGHRLFGPEWLHWMVTPGRLRDGRLSGSHRFRPEDASYGEVQYGMGFLLPPPGDGHPSVLHYGFISGFSACLETFYEAGLTTAILCNADPGPGLPFHAVRRLVARRILPAL